MRERFLRRHRSDPLPGEGPVRIIVGLGNPGRRYRNTRHNLGFMVLDRIANEVPPGTTRSRMQSELLETRLDGTRLVLVKPQTFMNESGSAVAQIVRWYRCPLTDLLVVYDELDLPFGSIRLRARGSDAGHNGMASVIQHLGSQEFPRLRVGIGRPSSGSTVPYVLSEFAASERPRVPEVIDRASSAALDWLNKGIETAMNIHNRRDSSDEM